MKPEKSMNKFISSSIKKELINELELQNIFDQMTLEELQSFWFHYHSNEIFYRTNRNIPSWKTSDQDRFFKTESLLTHYYPESKDKDGKYIYDRKDFEGHIQKFIFDIINEDIRKKREYGKKHFWEKIPTILLILTLIFIPIVTVCSFFEFSGFLKELKTVLFIIWFSIFGMYCISSIVISVINKSKIKSEKPFNK